MPVFWYQRFFICIKLVDPKTTPGIFSDEPVGVVRLFEEFMNEMPKILA